MIFLRLLACILFVLFSDLLYIGVIMKNHYINMIKLIQQTPSSLRKIPAVIASLTVSMSLWYICLADGQKWNSHNQRTAAILGCAIFLVYNTSNMAIFTKWSALTTIIDTTYGILLTTIVYALISVFI